MSFTSLSFFLFVIVLFAIYWAFKHRTVQNIIILLASYAFYCCWDWRFAFLLAFTTVCSYSTGSIIGRNFDKNQKIGYWANIINIVINLSILIFYKYFNFFADSFVDFANTIGIGKSMDHITLRVVLPVGISFYTFKALSYSIDIYKGNLRPAGDFTAFAAYMAFFTELPAGPIDKASRLVPQFMKERTFDYHYSVDGLYQILWGLFKKVVVANNCALYVNTVFESYSEYSAISLALAGILFSVQIYGDFSGYSDIAVGVGKLFGFDLMKNFNYPYFSRNIAEFWRKWHISLTSWFRDYLYIPLGGSRCSKNKIIRNIFIIYLVSGLWHGANWTFVAWGAYHAFLFLPLILTGNNKKYKNLIAEGKVWPSLKEICQMLLTFVMAGIGWIIFNSATIKDAYFFLTGMFSGQSGRFLFSTEYLLYILFALILFVVEWIQRDKEHGLCLPNTMPSVLRYAIYFIIVGIVYLFLGNEQAFIYMQF